MRVVVKKWGNSAALRVPAAVMEQAHLTIDQALDMRVEQSRIVIEPLHRPEFDLNSLLAAITPENLHEEASFGAPVGREAL
ncbi:MAG: PbsX family transcriptional regulator [Methylocystis sp.]|nr:PbsX family transcriptional regulator [Methylocystis sp.]MBI3274469.1 PbsX family transcriptional regulator [Methylocystis sp.]